MPSACTGEAMPPADFAKVTARQACWPHDGRDMSFQPDYCHLLDAAHNRRPASLPIYEHIIAPEVMEKVLGAKFAALGTSNNPKDLDEFFRHFCRFFAEASPRV